MHRTQIYLKEEHQERLARIAQDRGISKSEVVREILDREFNLASDVQDRLAVIRETAGILKDKDYPGWEEWQRSVRGRTADERLRDFGL